MAWYNPSDIWDKNGRGITAVATGGLSEAYNAASDSLKNLLFGEAPSVSSVSTLTPDQERLLKGLTNIITGNVTGEDGNVKGVSAYPGETVAGASPLQQTGFNLAGDLTGSQPYQTGLGALNALASGDLFKQPMDMSGSIQDMISQYSSGQPFSSTMSALTGMMQPYDKTAATDYWRGSVVDPAMKTFEDEIMPMISEKYSDSWGSGALNRAMTKAGSDLSADLGGKLSEILFNDMQRHTSNQLNAAPTLSNIGMTPINLQSGQQDALTKILSQIQGGQGAAMNASLPFATTPINTALDAGGIQRLIEQAGISGDVSKWQHEQPYNNPWYQFLSPALGTQAIQPVVDQGSQGLLSALMPGVGMGAGAYLASLV